MVFAYYSKLSRAQKAIYRKSDQIEAVPLGYPEQFREDIDALEQVLSMEDRKQTEFISIKLMNAIVREIKAPPLDVKVLNARPSRSWGELHGLYEPVDAGKKGCITVWMRTAKHKRVVAFRSFLRTLLHELCHHLDYEYFMLEDSFHTEGFFKRESSLFKQIMGIDNN